MSGDKERYRKLIDVLHQYDIGKYVELPQIAVMGDTSTGKSSLLSALSTGIEFPSHAEITTRCPVRLRLEKSEKSFAKVNIKWMDTREAVSSARDWEVRVISDWKNEEQAKLVTKAIQDAQEFILSRYNDDKTGVSSDIIEIEVYSSDCVDLTLVDLPGLVRTVAKNEKDELIVQIRSLINDYLKNERCIILAIVPANVDFHNSQILADAKTVDPDTKRTIPVITKPDTIGEGSENSVHKLLLGEETDFALGFNMCKCRSQKEVDEGLTLQESLRKEAIFFSVTEPWRSEENKSLFGVANLSNKLAKLQVQMIQDSMPSIISEIVKEKKVAAEDLKKLGQETADVNQMRGILDELKVKLIDSMKGIYDGRADINPKLSQDLSVDGYSWCAVLKKHNGTLSNKILKEKLNNITEKVHVGKVVLVSTADGSEFKATVLKVFNSENGTFVHVDPASNDDSSKCFEKDDDKGTECHRSIRTDLVRVSNDWLKTEIMKNKNQDLDCFLSCQVFKQIIHKLIKEDCTPICEAFMKFSFDMLVKLCEKSVDHIFPDNWPRLKHMLMKVLNELVEKLFQDTLSELFGKLTQEMTPYTQNDYLYETIKKKRNERLKNKILHVIQNMGQQCSISSVESVIKSFFDQNERMSVDDHNALEMEIILSTYGKVAAKRLIDDVPMISSAFFAHFFKNVHSSLQISDKDVETIMKEPPHIANKRANLKKKINDLSSAQRAIDDFIMGY